MPAYGKVKVDTITYDLSGTATDVSVADIATKASPTFTGTINAANLILSGDLTVNGTTTTIDTTTLQVEDKNIEIGKVSSPSDTTADGGGWTLKGATDKTFNWVNSTDAWTSSEHIHLGDNKKLLLGTGADLEIFFDGTHSKIVQTAGTNCYLASDSIILSNAAISKYYATATANGAVDLYHNNSKKFETTSGGAKVTGELQMGGTAGVKFSHSGTSSIYESQTAGDELLFKTTPSGGSSSTALTISPTQNATFAGTITGGAATFKSAAEPQLTLQDSDSSHTGAGAETGIHFKDGAGTLQSAIGHLVSTDNVLYFETAINADMVFKTNSSTRLSIGANGIATTGNSTCTGTVSDSKGDLRKIIQNTQGSAYTLVAADAGKHILASGNITIPNSVFSAGDGVVIVNNTSGDLTITSGITNLYLGTDGSTGNKTLASRCTCTVLFTSGTAGYISGGGLS